MSYQVLARKYRPKSFETLVGQEHVVRALTHALEQKRLHHAYLFTGTRGVGKTTLSRILAKAFNCETGITPKPCGVCEACTAIDAGRFVDYIEMDAASNRGVDEMAQLLEQAVYAPSNARFKVYMIDEVHMLTNHAFNSMLKTLEEPPDHVKFILATTDPQKIPVTVLSRCLQFNLKQMPPGHIVSHLDSILQQEDITFEAPALRLLAQGAHGSMRDALSLTDQAIAYAAGKVTLEAVQGMLGALDQSFLIRLLDALAAKDGAGLLAVADEMAARSLSYPAGLQDLATLLHRIALAQSVPAALAEDMPEREHIVRLAGLFDPEEIQLFYQIAVHGRNELGLAPDEYAGFSMTLLRMLAFRPGVGGGEQRPNSPAPAIAAAAPVARLNAAPQVAVSSTPVGRGPAGVSPARAALDAARGVGKAGTTATGVSATATSSAPTTPRPTATPTAAPVAVAPPPWLDEKHASELPPYDFPSEAEKDSPPQSAVNSRSEARPAAHIARAAQLEQPQAKIQRAYQPVPVAELEWDGNWPQLAAALPVRGVAQQLAQQSELVRCDCAERNPVFHLRVTVETLLSSGSVDKLAAALTERFGRTVRVETELGATEHTANAAALTERAARQKQTEEMFENDPFVQKVMREFGATIMPGSIKPA